MLTTKYEWDKDDVAKIWCLGPEGMGPNLLLNGTKGVQYIHEVKDSMEADFNWTTKEVVMAEEGTRGILVNIEDA